MGVMGSFLFPLAHHVVTSCLQSMCQKARSQEFAIARGFRRICAQAHCCTALAEARRTDLQIKQLLVATVAPQSDAVVAAFFACVGERFCTMADWCHVLRVPEAGHCHSIAEQRLHSSSDAMAQQFCETLVFPRHDAHH